MLRTLVKISNVTNLSDARYCAGMGVEWLGFSMDSLPVEKFQEIRGWVSGVQIVGETAETDAGRIAELVQLYQPDAVQVSAPEVVIGLGVLGLPVLLRVDAAETDVFDLEKKTRAALSPTLILENSDEFARLDDETRRALDALSFRHDVLLGFGITEGNALEILEELPHLKGIALDAGGDELRPGFKEFGELMNLLERLEAED